MRFCFFSPLSSQSSPPTTRRSGHPPPSPTPRVPIIVSKSPAGPGFHLPDGPVDLFDRSSRHPRYALGVRHETYLGRQPARQKDYFNIFVVAVRKINGGMGSKRFGRGQGRTGQSPQGRSKTAHCSLVPTRSPPSGGAECLSQIGFPRYLEIVQ